MGLGIARHQLSGFLRRGAIERRAIERLGVERRELRDGEFDRVLDLAGSAQVRAKVAEYVGELPADQREALRLRIIEERDYPEVAAQLGVSEPTARARVSRGLRALAVRLAGAHEEVDAS